MPWTKYDDLQEILNFQFQEKMDKYNGCRAKFQYRKSTQKNDSNKEYSPSHIKDPIDVTGGITRECTNTPAVITSLITGATAKVPVVLAVLTLQFNVESIIQLPVPALEIKGIKKCIQITQSTLIEGTNMLFIKGYVRKNIHYATRAFSNPHGVSGDIRNYTVDIPFKCTTPVTFNGIAPKPSIPNTVNEFEYYKNQQFSDPSYRKKDELMSVDPSEFNQSSTEYFNNLPFCELINSKIVEFNKYINSTHTPYSTASIEGREFRIIEEKMVIYLTLQILQNRQVEIPAAKFIKTCPIES